MLGKTELEILQECAVVGFATIIKSKPRQMGAWINLKALGLCYEVECTSSHAENIVVVKFGRKPVTI